MRTVLPTLPWQCWKSKIRSAQMSKHWRVSVGVAQLQLSQTQHVLGIYLKTAKLEGSVCFQINQIGSHSESLFWHEESCKFMLLWSLSE